jgi:2,4-dichlorophenol 6-monooxygenase
MSIYSPESPSSSGEVETDVLIVGSGPAGSSCALFLSSLGVRNMVITKYRWTANTPRAHITNQRTVEIFRDLGIEEDVQRLAVPQHLMGDTVFCTAIAGDELGRVRTWGTHPRRQADYTLASPSSICDIPQNLLEPILVGHAAERGSKVRFDTEYVSLEQDEHGVTATVRDRSTGHEYPIRAKYLVGADGGRSKVAQDIGLPSEGVLDWAGSMNIVFKADLSRYVAHRPSILYWVLQPGSDVGGIGLGLVRTVRPWDEWLIVWGYDISQPPPVIDDAFVTKVVHDLVGDDTIDVQLQSYNLWGNNKWYATRYAEGRVFCMGDACHRHPPSNGLGSNTSIQDAYNLAWKLAHVLRGHAGPGLLDSYDAERAPVGRQIVLRANKSIEEFGPIFEALGITDTSDPEVMTARIERRKDDSQEGAARREALMKALELKDYEFNAHGVEFNHRYRSGAVVPDGTPEPEFERDPELYYHPTTWPGARLPHVWLGTTTHQHDRRPGEKVSTHDIAGKGRWTLFTGISGQRWVAAAAAVAGDLGIELRPVVVGPGQEYIDTYDDWARAREVSEAGAVLVRPDCHVAWRSHSLADDPAADLRSALRRLLHLDSPEGSGQPAPAVSGAPAAAPDPEVVPAAVPEA